MAANLYLFMIIDGIHKDFVVIQRFRNKTSRWNIEKYYNCVVNIKMIKTSIFRVLSFLTIFSNSLTSLKTSLNISNDKIQSPKSSNFNFIYDQMVNKSLFIIPQVSIFFSTVRAISVQVMKSWKSQRFARTMPFSIHDHNWNSSL